MTANERERHVGMGKENHDQSTEGEKKRKITDTGESIDPQGLDRNM
jgi:hypothetical protein